MSNELAVVCQTIASPDFKNKIQQALPDGVTVDRFTRVTLTAIQQNPDVLRGERQSLYNAVIRCAQDGLQPDGREAALVVMGGTVSYMPMVGGLRKIAAKYGIRIATGVVYANDLFEYDLGVHPTKTHRPPPLGQPRGAVLGAWSEAIDRDGSVYLEVMDKEAIERVRAGSRAKAGGPWSNHWDEMARKTVARRLFKQLPLYDMDERDSSAVAAVDAEYDYTHQPASVSPIAARVNAAVAQPDPTPATDFADPQAAEGEEVF